MNPHKANLINASGLILISIWVYYHAINPNIMMLFPLLIGVVLLSLNNGVLYEYKDQVMAVIIITSLSIILLSWLFQNSFSHYDNKRAIYYGVMLGLNIYSLGVFIFFRWRARLSQKHKKVK
ncbi:MAG: hypothetical protein WAU01_14890 [Saprospiraceae bacterium]